MDGVNPSPVGSGVGDAAGGASGDLRSFGRRGRRPSPNIAVELTAGSETRAELAWKVRRDQTSGNGSVGFFQVETGPQPKKLW